GPRAAAGRLVRPLLESACALLLPAPRIGPMTRTPASSASAARPAKWTLQVLGRHAASPPTRPRGPPRRRTTPRSLSVIVTVPTRRKVQGDTQLRATSPREREGPRHLGRERVSPSA